MYTHNRQTHAEETQALGDEQIWNWHRGSRYKKSGQMKKWRENHFKKAASHHVSEEEEKIMKVLLICSVSLNSLSQLNVYSHLVFKHSETDNKRQSA